MYRFTPVLLCILSVTSTRVDYGRYGYDNFCKSIADDVCKKTLSERGVSGYGAADSSASGEEEETERLVTLIMDRLSPVLQGISEQIDDLKAIVEQKSWDESWVGQVMGDLRDFIERSEERTTTTESSGIALVSCQAEARGRLESSFAITCPSGCGQVSSRVWGTGIYTDDSSICKAAIHDGRITDSEGGTVAVGKREGKSSYSGSTRHGITTNSYGAWAGSFVFEAPSRMPDAASCSDRANVQSESVFSVRCPSGCDEESASVWGTAIYTDDSAICTAAIHDGRISAANGGSVTVYKIEGKSNYTGSTQNGVTTRSYGAWSGSFSFEETE